MRLSLFNGNPATFQKIKEKATLWLSLTFLVALIIIPISWFIWFLLFTNTFTVQAITILDAREHTTEAIRQKTEERMGKNIFFVQTPILEDQIKTAIPQIRDLHIVRKLPNTLKIIVQEKTPTLLLLSQKKYYFVDQEGIAFEEAKLETLPGTVLPIVKNSDQNANLTLGVPILSPAFVSFLQEAQKKLPESVGANVIELYIPSLAAREMHVRFDNNWIIKLDVTRGMVSQLAILKQLLDTTISPEEKAQLEYIDLRIPQRVYYKTTGSSI